jgi:hypothetical protein
MDDLEIVHVAACDLADTIATRLRRLEPESEILVQIDRLRAMLVRIASTTGEAAEE